MSKKKRIVMLSTGYWFGAHSLGLLVHPYQSMRRLVKLELYKPLVMLPGVCLLGWWMVGMVVSRFNVLSALGLSFLAVRFEHFGPMQLMLGFLFMWGVVFLVMWQVLLLYLYWRFKSLKNAKIKNQKSK